MTETNSAPTNGMMSLPEMEAHTRALVHCVRVQSARNWEAYAEGLAVLHEDEQAQAADFGSLEKLREAAANGDASALAFLFRCRLLTTASALAELCSMSSLLVDFVTIDEALAASVASFGDIAGLDVGAVQAVLTGVGALTPAARPIQSEPVQPGPQTSEAVNAAIPASVEG